MKLMIIPARSGSKRVPDKNIRMIGSYPLIVRTILVALENSLNVLFTTDSNKYIEIVKSYIGDDIRYELRPPELAGDKVRVVEEVSRICRNYDAKDTDVFGLMLPTSPFRSAISLKNCLQLHNKSSKGVFSAAEYSFPISFAFKLRESLQDKNLNEWSPVFEELSPMLTGNTRSQDQVKHYHPTGGIYIFNYIDFKEDLNMYNNSLPYLVEGIEALDIDSELDFKTASLIADNMDNIKK